MEVSQEQQGKEKSFEQANCKQTIHYTYIAIIFALVIFIIAIITGSCSFCSDVFSQKQKIDTNIVKGIKDVDRGVSIQKGGKFNLTGSLYLTLMPIDKSRAISIYSYDINSTKFKNLSLYSGSNISSKISPNGENIAFARPVVGGSMQIFVTNIATGDTKAVSKNNVKYKREPIWSPDGNSIAYIVSGGENRNNNSKEGSHNPEAWGVFIVGVGTNAGEERFITSGYNPIFSPDGNSLLVLKNEGLFLYDLTKDAESQKVWGVLGEKKFGAYMHSHMKLSLSKDGKKLAWSDHHRSPGGGLTLFTITSWKPFSMEIRKQLKGGFIYNVFSPDSNYLAVETYDEARNGQLTNGHVLVYDMSTFDFRDVFNLNGFDTGFLWLTDWR